MRLLGGHRVGEQGDRGRRRGVVCTLTFECVSDCLPAVLLTRVLPSLSLLLLECRRRTGIQQGGTGEAGPEVV